MNDNTVNIVSDYKGETSSAVRMGVSHDSHLPPLAHNRMHQKAEDKMI